MIDMLIPDRFQFPLPPAPAQVVIERLFRSKVADRHSTVAERLIADGRAKLEFWKREMSSSLADLEADLTAWDPRFCDWVEESIRSTEEMAEDLAIAASRSHKRMMRIARVQFATDPALGAVTRDFAEKYTVLERAKIEMLLESALYLRALLAERGVDVGTIEEFSDPDAFVRAMERAVA